MHDEEDHHHAINVLWMILGDVAASRCDAGKRERAAVRNSFGGLRLYTRAGWLHVFSTRIRVLDNCVSARNHVVQVTAKARAQPTLACDFGHFLSKEQLG